MKQAVDFVIKGLKGQGYNPRAVLGEVLNEFGYELLGMDYTGKEALDDGFRLNLSEYDREWRYAQQVYEDTMDSLERGLLPAR